MRMRRSGKKIVVLVLVFLVAIAAGIVFMTAGNRTAIVTYKTMESASLPVVYTEYEGTTLNAMHGYRESMQMQYMRDTITVLPEDRRLKLSIDTYGQEIVDISYEIRSLDTTRLVESTQLKEWETRGDKTIAYLPIQNLLSGNQEYAFHILLTTRDTGIIHYYTRIINDQSLSIEKMLDFAMEFHTKSMDPEQKRTLAAYVKTNTEPKDTFGRVSLNSTYAQITWGKLEPRQLTDISVSIKDLTESIATFQFSYKVAISDENGQTQEYNVVETYCVQQSGSSLMLLSFERTLDQIFDPEGQEIIDGNLSVGISSKEDLSYYSSSNEVYHTFCVGEELWSYDNDRQKLTRVFGFKEEGDDGVRTEYNAHDIQIVNVDDRGNINFIVYGYMNRGDHEGQCGLAFYEYHKREGVVEEIFYLPSDKPFEILKEEMGALSYLSNNGLFYLMLDNAVYAIDFAGNEFITIVENVTEDRLAISEDSSVIAWQEEENVYDAQQVQVLYLSDGSKYTVTAGEGEVLRTLGFISNDFICGIARKSDITSENGMITKLPVYALEIFNKDGEAETRYEKPGIYIEDVIVENGSVRLIREQKTSFGYVAIHEDALIQNSEVPWQPETKADKVNTELRRSIYVIQVGGKKETVTIGVTYVSKMLNENSILLSIASGNIRDDSFYAYAGGSLAGICGTVKEAVDLSYDRMGCVVDGDGNYILRRGYLGNRTEISLPSVGVAQNGGDAMAACLEAILKKENAMTDIKGRLEEGESSIDILSDMLPGRVVDLSGCSLRQIMYHYLNMGSPILALRNGQSVLINGYSGNDIKIFDPVTNVTETMKLSDAEDLFARSGNRFISYLKVR